MGIIKPSFQRYVKWNSSRVLVRTRLAGIVLTARNRLGGKFVNEKFIESTPRRSAKSAGSDEAKTNKK